MHFFHSYDIFEFRNVKLKTQYYIIILHRKRYRKESYSSVLRHEILPTSVRVLTISR